MKELFGIPCYVNLTIYCVC